MLVTACSTHFFVAPEPNFSFRVLDQKTHSGWLHAEPDQPQTSKHAEESTDMSSTRRAAIALLTSIATPSVIGARTDAQAAEISSPRNENCNDKCLSDLFGNLQPRNQASERDTFFSLKDDTIAAAYGAIRPPALRALLAKLQIDGTDVFTDVGSGIGNVVLQVYANYPFRKVRGIEYISGRHLEAVQNLEKYKQRVGGTLSREVELIDGDICKEDFSDSTIVFASSQCMDDKVLDCVKTRCEANRNLKYVVTGRPFASTSLRLLEEIRGLNTSWSDNSSYWIYSR